MESSLQTQFTVFPFSLLVSPSYPQANKRKSGLYFSAQDLFSPLTHTEQSLHAEAVASSATLLASRANPLWSAVPSAQISHTSPDTAYR